MNINRRLLFLDRFLAYNRLRYRDNPDALKRLDELQFEDMIFDGISVDNSKPGELRRRVANFHSDAQNMEGIDQRWTCTSLVNKKVLPPETYVNSTPFASLEAFQEANSQGTYLYTDEDGMTVLGVVLSTDSLKTENIAPELIALLNEVSTYQLLTSELTIEEDDYDKFPMHFTYMGDTIVGRITVIRQQADKPTKGNYVLGYYGEFPSDYIISSGVLAEMMGFTASNNKLIVGAENIPWLKFARWGKVLYIAKQSIGRNISWNDLNAAGLVDGSRIIEIAGKRYKVRLMRGTSNDPENNEWNDLIYRVHYQDPTKTFWETFTDADLGLGGTGGTPYYRAGSFVMMQEEVNASVITIRGGGLDGATLTLTGNLPKTSSHETYGWRPVLEYIGASGLSDVVIGAEYSPIKLDWRSQINSEFTGVLRPFGFSSTLIPDIKIIPSAVNIVNLYGIGVNGSTLAGKTSIPTITNIVNDAVRSPVNVAFDKFIPYPLEITSLGEIDPVLELSSADMSDILTKQEPPVLQSVDFGDILTKQDAPTDNAKFDGTFRFNGALLF